MAEEKPRCSWAVGQPDVYVRYHDQQWGTPVYDDHTLFEMLILESFHTGLSWLLILKKREAFREAFDNFDPEKIVQYDEEKIEELLSNAKIVRNRLKIEAAIVNAQAFLTIQKEYGSFCKYLWSFAENKIQKKPEYITEPKSDISDKLSQDMKRRGMKFLGSVTVHAYLQAVGVLDCHAPGCFRYGEKNERD